MRSNWQSTRLVQSLQFDSMQGCVKYGLPLLLQNNCKAFAVRTIELGITEQKKIIFNRTSMKTM